MEERYQAAYIVLCAALLGGILGWYWGQTTAWKNAAESDLRRQVGELTMEKWKREHPVPVPEKEQKY